jgi:hypothetical protein
MNVVNLRLLIYHLGNFKLFLPALIEHVSLVLVLTHAYFSAKY